MLRPGSWTSPAGEDPSRASTGAPGSRPQSGEPCSELNSPGPSRVRGAARAQGMAGTARSNHPDGRESIELHRLPRVDEVRRLRRQFWVAARQSPERRFHALHDRVHRGDVLRAAWELVRSHEGAAGVDGMTLADVETHGVQRMLDELARELRNHVRKTIGRPCAGRPHARFERGMGKRVRSADTALLTTNG